MTLVMILPSAVSYHGFKIFVFDPKLIWENHTKHGFFTTVDSAVFCMATLSQGPYIVSALEGRVPALEGSACSPDHSWVAGLGLEHHHKARAEAVTLRDLRKCLGASLSSVTSQPVRRDPPDPTLPPRSRLRTTGQQKTRSG